MASVAQKYRTFISRHEVAWELTFAALAVVFVLTGVIEDEPWLAAIELGLTAVFAAEFASRLAVAPSRRGYLREHWIDAIALVPPTRGMRLLRLLRLLRLVRAFAGVGRVMVSLDRLANHRGLVWLFVSWGAVMLVCSLGLYVAEHGVNEAVQDPYDALWWGLSTMTTVGYGDVYPVTPEGRLAAAVLMILGVGLYSAITAAITSALVGARRKAPPVSDRIRHLAALRDDGLVDEDAFIAKRDALLREL